MEMFSRGLPLWQRMLVPTLAPGVMSTMSEGLRFTEALSANMRIVERTFGYDTQHSHLVVLSPQRRVGKGAGLATTLVWVIIIACLLETLHTSPRAEEQDHVGKLYYHTYNKVPRGYADIRLIALVYWSGTCPEDRRQLGYCAKLLLLRGYGSTDGTCCDVPFVVPVACADSWRASSLTEGLTCAVTASAWQTSPLHP